MKPFDASFRLMLGGSNVAILGERPLFAEIFCAIGLSGSVGVVVEPDDDVVPGVVVEPDVVVVVDAFLALPCVPALVVVVLVFPCAVFCADAVVFFALPCVVVVLPCVAVVLPFVADELPWDFGPGAPFGPDA